MRLIQNIALVVLLMLSPILHAAVPVNIRLERVVINIHDKARIAAGAKFFATNCMSCHSMKYMAYNKVANAAGITLDKMPKDNAKWWFGTPPPDLSLAARRHSPEWIYTYLHSFYQDTSLKSGVNNLLVPKTSMPNILMGMQGTQRLVVSEHRSLYRGGPRYNAKLELVKQGSMTPEQFQRTMTDLVTFLVYAGDPNSAKRITIGLWVMLFLVVLLVLAYLLKKEYWKNIK